MGTPPTRLSKEARREQLLDAALTIVRTRGADELTLPTLAEVARVSRPIVYDHFATRAGLLLALYLRLDEQYRDRLAQALRDAEPAASRVARVMSEAYFTCATDLPEFTAVSAALKGSPALEATQRDMVEHYATLMATALRPHSGLDGEALRLRCVGVLGAAEAVAAELNRGRATAEDAVAALTDLILGTLRH
ncbi:TetR/AcrR family transcriptional regulator [Nonomuraea sp. NPDC050328]|uniref:TetR/AcrR family transcriptional regulator n=1 Tax=Nonomuraea sp. NPDC050328 TaxID=3364361 RepID=UPI0037912468